MEEQTQNQMATPDPVAPHQSAMPQEHSEHKKFWNINTIIIAVAIVAVLVTLGIIFASITKTDIFSGMNLGGGMSAQKVAEKSLEYINTNQLAGPGQTVTLGEVSSESGLVKFKLQIGEQSFDSYASKDGKFLFPTAISLDGAISE